MVMRSPATTSSGFGIVKMFTIGVSVIIGLFLLMGLGSLVENVDSTEIVVIQSVTTGKLTWYTTPGPKFQGLGAVTTYPKRSTYDFDTQVRFNDGGHAKMLGSVQWEMPLDAQNLTTLHTQFGSPEAIQAQLVAKVVNKAVTMTGPLMSSKESYAEKRNYLINYVDDQISNGVFRTVQRDVKVLDPLTGQEKSAVVVEIVQLNGVPVRQETSPLSHYSIKTSNFAIKDMPYDEAVEKQIQQQQQITMQVQTAIAESRQAEQRAITVEQQGRAEAAKAKWDQEVIKAREVTAGEQKLAVATLDNQTAEQYKQATLKRADADAGYRKAMMNADNALEIRLQAQVKIAEANAKAIENIKVPIVPTTVFGGTGGGNNAATLLDLMTIQAAKQVGLDK